MKKQTWLLYYIILLKLRVNLPSGPNPLYVEQKMTTIKADIDPPSTPHPTPILKKKPVKKTLNPHHKKIPHGINLIFIVKEKDK